MPKPVPARTEDQRSVKDASQDLTSVLERIMARMDELESRVAALERQPTPVALRPLPRPPAIAESHPLAQLSADNSSGALPAVGKLFLGVAGGYLLRHVAESGALPRLIIVLVAIIYAAAWLVWAARIPSAAKFTAAIYAATAALVFAPMIWETTYRFKVLPNSVSAAVLVGFVALGFGVAWKQKLAWVASIATILPAAVTLMLLVATRDPAPFTVALLVIALATEYAGIRGRWPDMRPVVAVLADAAIVVLILVYSGQSQIPPEYTPISTGLLLALTSALFVIYGTTILLSAVVKRRAISAFGILQAMIAFALAIINVLRATHGGAAVQTGVLCLLLAAACYVAVLGRFDRKLQARNYHVFAAWGAMLVLLGSFLSLPTTLMVLWLGLLAAAVTFIAVRVLHWSLGFHAVIYAAVAGYFSGLLGYAVQALAGALPEASGWSAWITAVLVAICCAVIWWRANECSTPQIRSALRLFFLSLLIFVAAALTVVTIARLVAPGAEINAPRLAVVRTIVFCAVILALSFGGSRWNRFELLWIRNAVIVLWTLKLLYEDLRYGTAGSIAISLFLYGTIWVLVPRLTRQHAIKTSY